MDSLGGFYRAYLDHLASGKIDGPPLVASKNGEEYPVKYWRDLVPLLNREVLNADSQHPADALVRAGYAVRKAEVGDP